MSKIPGQTMQVHGEQHSLLKRSKAFLRDNARQHSRQNVSHASSSHSRIACSIDEHLTVRSRHDRPESLQNYMQMLATRELPGHIDAIFIHECDFS